MAITQEDVAERAGVSRALVSLVMRNVPRVSPASREAVLKAAAELGYQPDINAARLASHRTKTIGVVLAQLHNPVYPETFTGVESRTEETGYAVLLKGGVDLDSAAERRAIEDLLAHRVDGIVFIGSHLATAELQQLAQRLPLVLAFRQVAGVDAISVDQRRGAQLAMSHLFDLGHEHIAHVDGGNGGGSRSRRRGYQDCMRDRGLAVNITIAAGDYTEPGGRAGGDILLKTAQRPTAIFAANDLSAIGVMAAAKNQGLGIPQDLSVVGFDNTNLSALGYISLTTVNQPRASMGAAAVDLLTTRIDHPDSPVRQLHSPPELVVRATTSAPR